MNHFVSFLIGIVLLAVGYSAFWFTAAFGLEERLDAYVSDLGRDGYSVRYDAFDVSGFPYRLTATAKGVQYASPGKGIEMRAASLTMSSHLWTPNHWVGFAEKVEAHFLGSRFVIESDLTTISHRVQEDKGSGIALEFGGERRAILAAAPGLESPMPLEAAYTSLRYGEPLNPADDSRLYGDNQIDTLLRFATPGLRLQVRANISGPSLPTGDKDGLGQWRDGGGLVTVQSLIVATPDSRVEANGSVALDDNFALLGSFTGAVTDGDSAGPILTALGLTSERDTQSLDGQKELSVRLTNGAVIINDAVITPVRPLF